MHNALRRAALAAALSVWLVAAGCAADSRPPADPTLSAPPVQGDAHRIN